MDRREFLGACLAAMPSPESKSTVVIARDPSLRPGDSAQLLKLLDRSVQSLYERDSAAEAWRQIARPGEVVGLKVNCLAGRGASTSTLLVDAVIERLKQAGIAARDILVWDRLNSDLESAGFPIGQRRDGLRYFGNDSSGYEEELSVSGSAGSRLSLTLTRQCQAVINLPVLKDHGIVGVTMALKNMFGAIHNPNKYHLNAGDPYVADVYAIPAVRQKVRLTLCDAITAQYEGGPSYMPQWCWPFRGLLASRDPVALDTAGWEIIEVKRAEMGFKPLKAAGRAPTYIATAGDARHRLGTCDPRWIRRVEA
jgi:uncharacterized protein (DUF362 family)